MPVADTRENRLKAFKNKGKDTDVRLIHSDVKTLELQGFHDLILSLRSSVDAATR